MEGTNIESVLKGVEKPVVGIAVTAFNRVGPEDFLPDYRICCISNGQDLDIIRHNVRVFSVEREGKFTGKKNASAVIQNEFVEKELGSLDGPHLLFYKVTKKVSSLCREKGWNIIGQIPQKELTNKSLFKAFLKDLGIPAIPGETRTLDCSYRELKEKYGDFVVQLPDSQGGKGTRFIRSEEDFRKAAEMAGEKDVLVSKFISGPSPSITCCVTRHGIISTNLQHQLLDIEEARNPNIGCGVFCGHDWTSSRFGEKVEKQAYEYVELIGQQLKRKGYRGLFGLDMVLDNETNQLYIVECNPRMLGSFPTLTMTQMLGGEPPILAFHIAEFLGVEYEMKTEKVNRAMRRRKTGAHLIIYNKFEGPAETMNGIKAGVYVIEDEKLKYLRPGYRLSDLKTEEEFAVVDDPPFRGTRFKRHERICRIITLKGLRDQDTYKLNAWGKKIVELVRRELNLREI